MAANSFVSIRLEESDRDWLEKQALARTIQARRLTGIKTTEITISDVIRQAITQLRERANESK